MSFLWAQMNESFEEIYTRLFQIKELPYIYSYFGKHVLVIASGGDDKEIVG